jgi:pimeloyl-ACP methyl ester carboxylesterase
MRTHYGVERWIAGGHSAGADLALAYTLMYPDCVLLKLHSSLFFRISLGLSWGSLEFP